MENLITENVRINKEAHAALVAFRRSKPWRGTFEEKLAKFNQLATTLGPAYGISPALIFHGTENATRPGNGAYNPRDKSINLIGKLSVVTLLHCFARARGKTRKESFAWSLSVFKKMFPVSFARCNLVGVMLIR